MPLPMNAPLYEYAPIIAYETPPRTAFRIVPIHLYIPVDFRGLKMDKNRLAFLLVYLIP